jgi:hypothetical protein
LPCSFPFCLAGTVQINAEPQGALKNGTPSNRVFSPEISSALATGVLDLEPRRKGHNTGPREGRSPHQIDDTG